MEPLPDKGALRRRQNVAAAVGVPTPELDESTFARLAGEAEKNCPVSKVLNATITLDAELI